MPDILITRPDPQQANKPSPSAALGGGGPGRMSYLRMVLSSVERASLWKVMMMLVGGRSLQYISRVHLGKKRQETTKTLGDKADVRGWSHGHRGGHQRGQMAWHPREPHYPHSPRRDPRASENGRSSISHHLGGMCACSQIKLRYRT